MMAVFHFWRRENEKGGQFGFGSKRRKEGRTHVDDLRESGRSRGHENLTNSVVELLDSLVRDSEESLSGPLLGLLVVEVPNGVLQRERLGESSDLGKNSNLKSTHRVEDLRVVLRVDRDEGVVLEG